MGSSTVSVINGTTNVVINNITLVTGVQEQEGAGRNGFFSPAGIAYDSDNGNLYVTNRGSDTLSVVNGTTNTLVNEISLDAIAPSGVIYNDYTRDLMVLHITKIMEMFTWLIPSTEP